jgi:nucleoside-diphosphate-sugar epimerase
VRIAVTGAAGFVGSAAITRQRAEGHDVLSLRRHEWDITTPRAPERVDAVVHCAALADDWASRAAAMHVNRDGTANVVASFPGARIVHVSTASVYDAFTPTVHATEGEPVPTRWLSAYAESKAAAEALLPRGAVILRPHAVYGPGDTTLLPRILSGVRRDRLSLPEGAWVPHTITHIDNLVQAIVLAVEGTASGVFNVGDDGDVILGEVLMELLDKQGWGQVAIRSIPYGVAFGIAAGLEAFHGVFGGRPRLTRYAVSQLGLERTLDLSKARRELGYRPTPTTLTGAESW